MPNCKCDTSKMERYEAMEHEHMGCSATKTGIYAEDRKARYSAGLPVPVTDPIKDAERLTDRCTKAELVMIRDMAQRKYMEMLGREQTAAEARIASLRAQLQADNA